MNQRLCLALAASLFSAFLSIGANGAPSWAQADVTELEEDALQAAVAKVAPSVVRIETLGGLEKVGKTVVAAGPTTGLVVSEDGYVVSSAINFVQQPSSILVTLSGGKRAAAQIVARDHSRMLVLLKVTTTEKLTVPTAVPRAEMTPGQWSVAVGRTFDPATPNASVGIVSATNRIWGKAIQTDAKISPNNYGGPLVDIRGRVFGVLVPLSTQTQGEQPELAGAELYDSGIGFAVPLEDILARLPRWKEGKDLYPGLLGIALKGSDNNSDEAEVARVQVKSPAAEAGWKAGDKIVELGGRKVGRLGELRHALGPFYAGEKVPVVVARGSDRISAELTLAEKIEPYVHPFVGVLPSRAPSTDPGVVVRWVFPSSPAEKAGLKVGDRIVGVGEKPAADVKALQDLVAAFEAGQKIPLSLVRDGQPVKLDITSETMPVEVPAKLPASRMSRDLAGVERPAVGVVPIRLPEEKNECVAYVPENYDPQVGCGLVVWLHAPGGFDEKELVERWKTLCDANDLILLAPKAADPARWQPTEVEFIRKTMDEVRGKYRVDPQRVVVHGYQAGGALSFVLAFDRRDVVRGVAVVDAAVPLRTQMPENDPFQRLAVYVTINAKSPAAVPAQSTAKRLSDLKFPVTAKALPEARYLNDEELAELVRWIDTLDRI